MQKSESGEDEEEEEESSWEKERKSTKVMNCAVVL
jgi:hypothetical protein